jgi:hypothetical protein
VLSTPHHHTLHVFKLTKIITRFVMFKPIIRKLQTLQTKTSTTITQHRMLVASHRVQTILWIGNTARFKQTRHPKHVAHHHAQTILWIGNVARCSQTRHHKQLANHRVQTILWIGNAARATFIFQATF